MLFQFTESNYDDAFKFGGRLTLHAESPNDAKALIDHFKLFNQKDDIDTLRAKLAAIESGNLSHTIGKDKRPIYAVESCLDDAFIAPYKEWAKRRFGFGDLWPDMEIPREWDGLKYTNYQTILRLFFSILLFLAICECSILLVFFLNEFKLYFKI